MKRTLQIILLFISLQAGAQQVSMCSWNIQNFGKSKSDEELAYIADVIDDFDVTAIIEVVAGTGGPEAVERLAAIMNKNGNKWSYAISNPTSGGSGTERYAYVWKKSKLRMVGSWLEEDLSDAIDREPFFITFERSHKQFTLGVFHAVPTAKHPELEIPLLKDLVDEYPHNNIILCADFNLSQANPAFDGLKHDGYEPTLMGQKTSLRAKCVNNDCLASEYDNIFYRPDMVHYKEAGHIPFHEDFATLKEAKTISDHIPIYFQFSVN